jgi:hypothetical protein
LCSGSSYTVSPVKRVKKPPDILTYSSEPFDDVDDIPLYASRAKKPPDKDLASMDKALMILDDCCISREEILVENSFPSSKIPVSGVDGVRLKKKKRKRRKGKGLLSRKNFVYDRGRNTWTLVGDYHVPPAPKPLLSPPRKKRKKKDLNLVVNYTDSADVKWALVNRVILNAYCSGFREVPYCCKLDQTKELIYRSGRAKNVCLSISDTVDLFARISDAWDCFEEELVRKLTLAHVNPPLPGKKSVDFPVKWAGDVVSCLRGGSSSVSRLPGEGRAACV